VQIILPLPFFKNDHCYNELWSSVILKVITEVIVLETENNKLIDL